MHDINVKDVLLVSIVFSGAIKHFNHHENGIFSGINLFSSHFSIVFITHQMLVFFSACCINNSCRQENTDSIYSFENRSSFFSYEIFFKASNVSFTIVKVLTQINQYLLFLWPRIIHKKTHRKTHVKCHKYIINFVMSFSRKEWTKHDLWLSKTVVFSFCFTVLMKYSPTKHIFQTSVELLQER